MRSREGGASSGLAVMGGAVVVFVGLAFGLARSGVQDQPQRVAPVGCLSCRGSGGSSA